MGKMVILKLLQPFIEPKSNLFYRKSGQNGLNYTDLTIGTIKNPRMSQMCPIVQCSLTHLDRFYHTISQILSQEKATKASKLPFCPFHSLFTPFFASHAAPCAHHGSLTKVCIVKPDPTFSKIQPGFYFKVQKSFKIAILLIFHWAYFRLSYSPIGPIVKSVQLNPLLQHF